MAPVRLDSNLRKFLPDLINKEGEFKMNKIIEQNKEWIESTWAKVDKKLSKTAVKSRDKIPYTTVNGVHDNRVAVEPDWWTNGFWGGTMWLMYKATGNEEYRKTAERSEELLDKALECYDRLHHDVGFMWHLTSGANYRITGNKAARNKNLFMACTLMSRYNIDGKYIRAWNGEWECENKQHAYSIIDCLMNIPLLYWASKEIDDPRFKRVAMSHMDMSARDHIRPDGSVNHIVVHETEKPGVQEVLAGQGYSNTSCWSRGLAWAVYGSILSYIHAGKDEYLDCAVRTADYFIDHCKETGYLPLIDFNAPAEPVYYDSTAGVCAACGMLEIAKYVENGDKYVEAAINILKATDERCNNYSDDEDALVLMGSERYPTQEEWKKTVHMPIIYADFFFVEALFKLKGNDFLIW